MKARIEQVAVATGITVHIRGLRDSSYTDIVAKEKINGVMAYVEYEDKAVKGTAVTQLFFPNAEMTYLDGTTSPSAEKCPFYPAHHP